VFKRVDLNCRWSSLKLPEGIDEDMMLLEVAYLRCRKVVVLL